MEKDRLNRELAESIELYGNRKNLKYIGSGTTAIAYTTEDGNDIIKEFCPTIKGQVTMYRSPMRDGLSMPLEKIETLSPYISALVDERRMAFLQEEKIIKELNSSFKAVENNMFIVPETVNTSLDKCQRCVGLVGETLGKALNKKRISKDTGKISYEEYFSSVLTYVTKVFYQIELYHKHGYLNLDVKPDNLFVIPVDTYKGVRNIDFGSTKRVDDVLSVISKSREKTQGKLTKKEAQELGSKLFASSAPYYSENMLQEVIEYCYSEANLQKNKEKALKSLDVVAAWKLLLFELLGKIEIDEYKSEQESFEKILKKALGNQTISARKSVATDYNIFFKLLKTTYMMLGDLESIPTAASASAVLKEILAILNPKAAQKEQEGAIIINENLKENEKLYEENNLKTVSQIIEFSDSKEGPLPVPTPGELNWFLKYGQWHS